MKTGIVMAIGIALVVTSVAPGFGRTIKKRARSEENRIEQGKESGRLTPKEAERLENQQEIIDKERGQAMEDGKMTHRERRDIKHDQKRLSKDIYRKKHNKQRE
jgi:hypothetical protein